MSTLNKRERVGAGLAAGSVLLVGGSVAASSFLGGYPVLGGQAVRYLAAGFSWRPGRGCSANRCPARQAGNGRGWPHWPPSDWPDAAC